MVSPLSGASLFLSPTFLAGLAQMPRFNQPDDPGKSLEDYPTKTIKTHECNRSEFEAKEGHMGGG